MSDVINLMLKESVVVCPKDDVISLSLILVIQKIVFHILWDFAIIETHDRVACGVWLLLYGVCYKFFTF